jgi:hypothetical protein
METGLQSCLTVNPYESKTASHVHNYRYKITVVFYVCDIQKNEVRNKFEHTFSTIISRNCFKKWMNMILIFEVF